MKLSETLAHEIGHELALCREILARLPDDMLGWKPHAKSPRTGELAAHIADMAEWIVLAARTQALDYATRAGNPAQLADTAALLAYFDARAAQAAEAVRGLSARALQQPWIVRHGPRVFIKRPRERVIRVDCLNHIIHHRGQLTVYCRLRDVALPGVYGPNGEA